MRCCYGKRMVLAGAALLTAVLPFWAPEACAQALREGLQLCGGPLLLSLFPFLIVSTLLVRTGAGDLLGVLLRPLARLSGAKAPCSGGILLMGFAGGFAPAANAASQAVRSSKLSPGEAAALLPACICSGPSFVILTVGQGMLGSTGVGVRLFAAQAIAGILSAAVLCRMFRPSESGDRPYSDCRCRRNLLQALRLHSLFPAAGRRTGGRSIRAEAAGCHDFGSMFRLRSGFPSRPVGQLALLCCHQSAGIVGPAAGSNHLPPGNLLPAAADFQTAAPAPVSGIVPAAVMSARRHSDCRRWVGSGTGCIAAGPTGLCRFDFAGLLPAGMPSQPVTAGA